LSKKTRERRAKESPIRAPETKSRLRKPAPKTHSTRRSIDTKPFFARKTSISTRFERARAHLTLASTSTARAYKFSKKKPPLIEEGKNTALTRENSLSLSRARDANDASHSMRTHRANETLERTISSTKHTYRLLYVILAVIVFSFLNASRSNEDLFVGRVWLLHAQKTKKKFWRRRRSSLVGEKNSKAPQICTPRVLKQQQQRAIAFWR